MSLLLLSSSIRSKGLRPVILNGKERPLQLFRSSRFLSDNSRRVAATAVPPQEEDEEEVDSRQDQMCIKDGLSTIPLMNPASKSVALL